MTKVKEDHVMALCMLLLCLAYPTQFADIEMQFGWERSRFSQITWLTALKIWSRWKHLLQFDASWLTRSKLAEFAWVIQAKGAPLDLVAALIDSTLRKNARPVHNQQLVFNGWKLIHCLKYHALISPDGLIIYIYGPVDGRQHDQTVFAQSGLSTILKQYFWTPSSQALYIYGDSGYTPRPHMLFPFKGPALSAEEKQFNYRMSCIWEPVEWIFPAIRVPWLCEKPEDSPHAMWVVLHGRFTSLQCTYNSPLPTNLSILQLCPSIPSWIFQWFTMPWTTPW